jgi:hypothetical protein
MPSDPSEFIGRKKPVTRYKPASKFDRRLKSHNRPVNVQESVLPPDSPENEFITKPRSKQA